MKDKKPSILLQKDNKTKFPIITIGLCLISFILGLSVREENKEEIKEYKVKKGHSLIKSKVAIKASLRNKQLPQTMRALVGKENIETRLFYLERDEEENTTIATLEVSNLKLKTFLNNSKKIPILIPKTAEKLNLNTTNKKVNYEIRF